MYICTVKGINKYEMKGVLLLKLNYIAVYHRGLSFIHFSIVLTFPAVPDAEIILRSL
jgi:hypothetical protein